MSSSCWGRGRPAAADCCGSAPDASCSCASRSAAGSGGDSRSRADEPCGTAAASSSSSPGRQRSSSSQSPSESESRPPSDAPSSSSQGDFRTGRPSAALPKVAAETAAGSGPLDEDAEPPGDVGALDAPSAGGSSSPARRLLVPPLQVLFMSTLSRLAPPSRRRTGLSAPALGASRNCRASAAITGGASFDVMQWARREHHASSFAVVPDGRMRLAKWTPVK
mmetsp:Transcript_49628/g.131208  ORF Transcript_49628/g.131208 Transcript_49628/m.131208 type:complete len:222 (-) Transcript_49628:477-1142(-)